jgi:glyoxylase-like metal-dependent hydrolase (beta-lactamase superfamily II)
MQVSSHCWAVTGLAYLPPWELNAGFIAGDHTTLVVDTAASALAAATIHGYASLARPGNRLLVINTERHFDHIGGNGYFRERGAEILGHPACARTEEEFRAEIAEFNAAIGDPMRRAGGEAEVFYRGTTLAAPTRFITQDTGLDLGALEVRVILTPGHTPSNLAVYVPSEGVVYSGDCLVNGYLPNLACGAAPEWRQWLDSIARIERLAPEAVVPGHGPVARGAEVQEMIEHVRAALNDALRTG